MARMRNEKPQFYLTNRFLSFPSFVQHQPSSAPHISCLENKCSSLSMPSAADLPRLFQRPPGKSRFAWPLPASEVIQRVEIAESPVKRAFRGVRPPPVSYLPIIVSRLKPRNRPSENPGCLCSEYHAHQTSANRHHCGLLSCGTNRPSAKTA